ncbi:NUDIX domain-containing protein [Altererythrobacter aurantiacus]|uniref:NUDIX domain-containing protein n=1 Tax=Parapontixanthobacter aurantiacus TaxID=1463599 RepID=A0A844ZFI5_9SPHN|nr:NUDIX domain-containing protein [Parapontixanthobacter aurantiacus]MXO85906.1 NUDIX domain-containing protein [Parapontixanthobacter aurantiacus]
MTSSRTPDASEEIPAATLVIFRNGRIDERPEILMVVRSRRMSFAGGAAVFPGGRVDEADRVLARSIAHQWEDDDQAAHRICAIRETLEETGLAIGFREAISAQDAEKARRMLLTEEALQPVLDRFGWTLDLDALTPFARWLPRGITAHRVFDTWFYLADTGTGNVEITVDATENTRLFWVSAQAALDMAESGEISIIFPTRRNLERLAQFDSYAAAKAQAERIPVRTITPQTVQIGDRQRLTIPEGLGYPITSEDFDDVQRG